MVIRTGPWWLPGGVLVAFGFLIAVFPELLALLVASAFIIIGMSWLAMGWGAQQMRRQVEQAQQTRIYHYEERRG